MGDHSMAGTNARPVAHTIRSSERVRRSSRADRLLALRRLHRRLRRPGA